MNATDMSLLKEVDTIFILTNIFVRQNGITNSVIRKMKLFHDEWDYKPLLLIAEYNIEIKRIHLMLEKGDYNDDQTRLSKGTKILGVYDYFQKSYLGRLDIMNYKKPEIGPDYRKLGNGVFGVYKDGLLASKEYYSGFAGRLRMVERFDEQQRLVRAVFYDDYGYISKIRNYDPENSKHFPSENFYTTDRKLCIKAEYAFINDENKLQKLLVYDDDQNLIKECADDAELAALCIDKITSNESKTYMAVAENGLYAKAVALVNKRNVIRAAVIHSAFLEDSQNLRSKPQMFYKYLCENNKRFEGIVILTDLERRDFIRKFGNFRNTFVISHPYPHNVVESDFDLRDTKKAIIIARFDPIKQIDHAIEIFKLVVDEVPDAVLEIYGFGSEEAKYREKIEALELQNNVIIKGFTNDPASVFRSAALYMMTSRAEGFPLTLAESVCNGCPIFSYDFKYGPSDVIKEGKTGFLFPINDKKAFADKMVKYFRDEERQKQMSENCYKDSGRFSKDEFLKKWYAFMQTLCNRR